MNGGQFVADQSTPDVVQAGRLIQEDKPVEIGH